MSGLTAHFLFGLKESPSNSPAEPAMALNLDQIRALAQRVAASHGLDVVEVEYQGAAKFRTLRIFIEKNAEERARLAAKGPEELTDGEPIDGEPDGVGRGSFNVEQLSGITHDDC